MDLIFCKALLGVADAVVSVDACASAMATIRAAEIQASAARFAGWLTLIAGAGAILGGLIAYVAQLKSARLQVRLSEAQEVYRQEALLRSLLVVAHRVSIELRKLSIIIGKIDLESYNIRVVSELEYLLETVANPIAVNLSTPEFSKEIKNEITVFYTSLSVTTNTLLVFDWIVNIYQNDKSIKSSVEGFKTSALRNLESSLKSAVDLGQLIAKKLLSDIKVVQEHSPLQT